MFLADNSESQAPSRSITQRRMRDDWERRAREDAAYYVAFGGRKQKPEEFFASAGDALSAIRSELYRLAPRTSALEIGCGPGRLMRPLSAEFDAVSGVDVSPTMVALARENLAATAGARVELSNGSDLRQFASESIDFCYSYAVFQHIPERAIVLSYMREACRVLKPGGVFRFQVNGLPRTGAARPEPIAGWSARSGEPAGSAVLDDRPDTWSGVSFSGEEIAAFAAGAGMQLPAMDGFDTQYLWVTMRKPCGGEQGPAPDVRIARVTNCYTDDCVIPRAGRFAAASLWVPGLNAAADLNNLRVEIDGTPTAPSFIGRRLPNAPWQVNVYLPPGARTGILPVRLLHEGLPREVAGALRVIPEGPATPRVVNLCDGVNLLSKLNITSRAIKVQIEEAPYATAAALLASFRAAIDGHPIADVDAFCIDPLPRLFELNLGVPDTVPPGSCNLYMTLGRRKIGPLGIQVAPR